MSQSKADNPTSPPADDAQSQPPHAPTDPAAPPAGAEPAGESAGQHAGQEAGQSPDQNPAGAAGADLKAELEAAKAKADENWERFLRATAEQDNIRKRAERDVEQARRFALERFARDLLGVSDSLELALKAAEEGDNTEGSLLEGLQMTRRMLLDTLTKHGISEMAPKGETFDPAKHEAMSAVPSADAAPNTVLEVVQKGYLLNERVLRPAMVVVAQAPA